MCRFKSDHQQIWAQRLGRSRFLCGRARSKDQSVKPLFSLFRISIIFLYDADTKTSKCIRQMSRTREQWDCLSVMFDSKPHWWLWTSVTELNDDVALLFQERWITAWYSECNSNRGSNSHRNIDSSSYMGSNSQTLTVTVIYITGATLKSKFQVYPESKITWEGGVKSHTVVTPSSTVLNLVSNIQQ